MAYGVHVVINEINCTEDTFLARRFPRNSTQQLNCRIPSYTLVTQAFTYLSLDVVSLQTRSDKRREMSKNLKRKYYICSFQASRDYHWPLQISTFVWSRL